jgi:hypothetical protein
VVICPEEVALSTSDPQRHLRVTSVRSKVALSFDAHSPARRHERRAAKRRLPRARENQVAPRKVTIASRSPDLDIETREGRSGYRRDQTA